MRVNIEKEIILSPIEAQAGVLLRLNNQVNKKCYACNGSGEKLLSSSRGRRSVECAECDETGTVESREEIDARVGRIDEINNLPLGQIDKKIVFESLGNYSKEEEGRGDLILTIKIENICVKEENRDFTIISYENLDNFREKFDQEQENFCLEKNKPVFITQTMRRVNLF